MKFRNFPLIITLLSGFITCIIAIICRYEIEQFLLTLAIVMMIFCILGILLRSLLNKAIINKEELEKDKKEAEEAEKDDNEQKEEKNDTKNETENDLKNK